MRRLVCTVVFEIFECFSWFAHVSWNYSNALAGLHSFWKIIRMLQLVWTYLFIYIMRMLQLVCTFLFELFECFSWFAQFYLNDLNALAGLHICIEITRVLQLVSTFWFEVFECFSSFAHFQFKLFECFNWFARVYFYLLNASPGLHIVI